MSAIRQRRLFGGTAATRAPFQTGQGGGWGAEHKLHAVAAEYLAFALAGIGYWKGIDAANKDAKERVMRAARGCRAGVPDFEVLAMNTDPSMVFIGLEAKARDGRVSPAQHAIRAEIEAAGGHWYVFKDTFELEAILREHRIPVRARHLAYEPVKKVRASRPAAEAKGPAKKTARPVRKAAP